MTDESGLNAMWENVPVEQPEDMTSELVKEHKRLIEENGQLLERVTELEAALDKREIDSGLTAKGNLWRFWAEKAKDMAMKNAALKRKIDSFEADAEAHISRLEYTRMLEDQLRDARAELKATK